MKHYQAVLLGIGALALGPACAHDEILPVDSVCGDFKLQGKEECDVASDGCIECQVARGWTCTEQECIPICGDGLTVSAEECDSTDRRACDSACHAATKAEPCDMTGYWIARQTTFQTDTVLIETQTASNWFAFHFTQTGDAFLVDAALACGLHVSGSGNVDLTPGGIRGMMYLNSQGTLDSRGQPNAHGPRHGTFTASGDACSFSMDRFYFVRGVDEWAEPSFLPPDFLAKPDLPHTPEAEASSTLRPLPYETNPAKPTKEHLDGALDIDGDGILGLKYVISGSATGTRNSAQRDYGEYFTSPDIQIPQSAIEFTAGTNFDNQESVLQVSGCPPVGCGILLAGGSPDPNKHHRITFQYLGKDLTEKRVSDVIVAELRQPGGEDNDYQTCANVRTHLPHDSSRE